MGASSLPRRSLRWRRWHLDCGPGLRCPAASGPHSSSDSLRCRYRPKADDVSCDVNLDGDKPQAGRYPHCPWSDGRKSRSSADLIWTTGRSTRTILIKIGYVTYISQFRSFASIQSRNGEWQ